MFGLVGNNLKSVKFIGRRDMSMNTDFKKIFDDSDEYYYYPYLNDAKELFRI